VVALPVQDETAGRLVVQEVPQSPVLETQQQRVFRGDQVGTRAGRAREARALQTGRKRGSRPGPPGHDISSLKLR
jgi:hypothetical protein